jgi:hypothetical protein
LEQLAEALGESAVWLSESVLLAPAVDEAEWHQIIAAIEPIAETDVFEFGRAVGENGSTQHESFRALFSDEEWKKLQYSPIVVFALVASADGAIDKHEIQCFQQQLIHELIADDHIMQQIVTDLMPNATQFITEVLEGDVEPKSVLESITAIVDNKLSTEDAMQYKLTLIQIGKSIAKSSGGFLGMFGDKISKEEKQTLAALTAILKIAPLH